MTYYGGREFAASFRTVRQNTIQIPEEIPESSFGFKPAESLRTVGQTLAHIAMVSAFQTCIHRSNIDTLTKVNFPELLGKLCSEEAKPRSKAELIAFLETEGEKFTATKSRLEMLLSAKEHEMHHRGRLMMVQRILGLTPHLTCQMQERFAQSQAAQQQAHR